MVSPIAPISCRPTAYLQFKEVMRKRLRKKQWKPISTAPKDREILAKRGELVFITKYTPETVEGSGFGVIHSCCGFYEDQKPTHWIDIP